MISYSVNFKLAAAINDPFCPLPFALCPLLYALCPLLYALCFLQFYHLHHLLSFINIQNTNINPFRQIACVHFDVLLP